MLSKKTIAFNCALALLSLPIISNAANNLVTYNNTNEDSAVKILKTGICSSKVPVFGTYTKAHDHSTVFPLAVRTICGGGGTGSCIADIYMTKDCTGAVVAKATLDLASITVTNITNLSTKHNITASGSTVNLNYA